MRNTRNRSIKRSYTMYWNYGSLTPKALSVLIGHKTLGFASTLNRIHILLSSMLSKIVLSLDRVKGNPITWKIKSMTHRRHLSSSETLHPWITQRHLPLAFQLQVLKYSRRHLPSSNTDTDCSQETYDVRIWSTEQVFGQMSNCMSRKLRRIHFESFSLFFFIT